MRYHTGHVVAATEKQKYFLARLPPSAGCHAR